MLKNEEQLIAEEIIDYIRSCRCSPDSWYAGVTSDPLRCLQYEHGISVVNNLCTLRKVSSVNKASHIVSILINKYGLEGKTNSESDENSFYIYAFQKKRSTFP